jgi:signal transduction histidine kinase
VAPSDRDVEAELQRSELRYRSLVENLLNGVVQLRVVYEDGQPSDFVFVETNAAFGAQLGLHDVIGKRVSEVVPSFRTADPVLFGTYCRVAVTGVPERLDTYSAAVQQWFSISVYRAAADHIVVILEDITLRKRAEQDTQAAHERLQQLNAELERRVLERTAELESFSYSISHDLRSPLRTVNGYAHIVLEDHGELLPEEARRLLLKIQEAGVRMGDLIDDLLRFSQLGRRALRRHTVDTDRLVRGVLDELVRGRTTPPVELRIGALAPCNADGALLRQVWVNLASNALKYSRNCTPAVVEVGSTPDGMYFIRDNGVGFDPRYAHRLFGVFQRLHSTSEFEGTGIGLAIVDRIVRRHGGRVWAETELGRGSTFYFRLDGE